MGAFSTSSAFGSTAGSSSSLSTPAFGTGMGFTLQAPSSTPFGSTTSQNSSIFGVPSTHSPFGSFGSTTIQHSSPFGVTSTYSPSGSCSLVGSSSFFSAPGFGSIGSTSPWLAPTFGSAMASSSSWSAPVFGRSMPHPPSSSQLERVSEKGSRVSPYSNSADVENSSLQSISAMPVYKSKSHEELRREDYQKGDKGGCNLNNRILTSVSVPPTTRFIAPLPAAVDQPSSTRGLNCTSNPFWLPSSGPRTSFSSAELQSSTQGLNWTSNSLFSRTFQPSKPVSVQTQSSALFARPAEPTNDPNGGFSSVAHSSPALFPDAHCTSVNIDCPKGTVDLLLPCDIRLVRIRFFSRDDSTGNLASQVHSVGHQNANDSATPVSLSVYPGENQEFTIRSLKQHPERQTGKPSTLPGGFSANNETGQTGKPSNLPGGLFANNETGCSKVNVASCSSSSAPTEKEKADDSNVLQTKRSPLAASYCGVISESVLPRLYKAEYYTLPSFVELALRERDEPGYCSHVKDFTVGRHGYGSVKFDGETDVRNLDIASIVEFKDREILVYGDESKAPTVGKVLNKPAEVTLLNVKCVDQKTGSQFTEGPMVDRYKEILVQWTKEHDAEFVSFDAAKGEWKFRVKHFNQ